MGTTGVTTGAAGTAVSVSGVAGTPTRRQRRRRRPYVKSGFHALKRLVQADEESWLRDLGAVGVTLTAWRAQLVADLGGASAMSTAKWALLAVTVRTWLLLESVDRWLLRQSSLVNKSRRQLFPVVLQRQQLADSLARHLGTLGLERRAAKAPTLAEVLAQQADGEDAATPATPETPATPREPAGG